MIGASIVLLFALSSTWAIDPTDSSDESRDVQFGRASSDIPTEESGRRVEEWTAESGVNPEELGEYFEGDIIDVNLNDSRNGVINPRLRWPNAVIPYVIAGPFKRQTVDIIRTAMNEYHRRTCIRFRPKTKKDRNFINIQNTKTGCWSKVGKVGGKQHVNLQTPGCTSTIGTPIHELMHAVGFYHEQSRTDRDNYVTILWQNIQRGRDGNFKKYGRNLITSFGTPYDYKSVMHYSAYAFSKNKKPTIVPKKHGVTIGQRSGLSPNDIRKINLMYRCRQGGNADKY